MTDTRVELDICGDCAQVIANGECGACESIGRDDCPHGGNERYPARYLALDEPLDLGWTMNKWCELHQDSMPSDGTDWYRVVFDPPAVSLVRPDGWAAGWSLAWSTHYASGTYYDCTRTEVKVLRRELVSRYFGLWLDVETYRD